jgi:hypothetical protein
MDMARMKRVSDLAELVWEESESEWASILAHDCAGDVKLLSEVAEFVRRCKTGPSLSLRVEISMADLI